MQVVKIKGLHRHLDLELQAALELHRLFIRVCLQGQLQLVFDCFLAVHLILVELIYSLLRKDACVAARTHCAILLMILIIFSYNYIVPLNWALFC